MAHVVSIVYRPRDAAAPRPQDRYARVPLERARLVEFQGIEGDAKGSSGDRQLNVMLAETMVELGTEGFQTGAGELGEQIVIAGLEPTALTEGVKIQLGQAVIEIGIPRTGCARFEKIQGKLRQSAKGRLGALARVLSSGEVAVGDRVEVQSTPNAANRSESATDQHG